MTLSPALTRRRFAFVVGAGAALLAVSPAEAKRDELIREARQVRDALYAAKPKARDMGRKAKAVLVFPGVRKAGAMVGGQYGDGVLFHGDEVKGFYSIAAGSFGLQLGAQKFSYALFLMTDKALQDLHTSGGWAVGSSPSLVLVDEGFARTMNTSTLSKDVYAVTFGQSGLMGGSGLEGSKITQIYPDG